MQMKLTTDYALRIVLELAQQKRPMNSREISEEIGVSQFYIQQILGELRAAGIVESKRGAHGGGYQLLKDPKQFTVMDVVSIFEKTVSIDSCLERAAQISEGAEQRLFSFWERVQRNLEEQLMGTRIADLLT
ncbi:MAG: Rrf2 family transcriptional regulator [Acutalibacteraceae bacterium]|nr:Rrf2 family transcriptional regulator [Acutalibacteraceae bacterium]